MTEETHRDDAGVIGSAGSVGFPRASATRPTNVAAWWSSISGAPCFRSLVVTLIPIVFIRLLFVYTYPLNNMGGDTNNYFTMLMQGKSSLVHAAGYPFLFGLFWWNPIGQSLINEQPQTFSYLLLLAQHVIDVGITAIMFVVLYSLYGRWTAVLAALTYGLSFFGMSWVSYVYPEWLQGGLLVLSLCTAYYALRTVKHRRKIVLYSLVATLFTWSVLVKFNSVLMLPLFLAVFIAESSTFRKRLLYVLIAGSAALANILVFLLFYHYPSTGTFELTMDRAWLLMTKLEVSEVNLSANDGINSKRWLALNGVLPNNYFNMAGPGLFSSVNAVPVEVRQPYRDRYLELFDADEQTLGAVILDHPLPNDFQLRYSSLPISYYIGLEEAEQLGTMVFLEAVWANRSAVIADTLQTSISGLSGLGGETMPTRQNMSAGRYGLREVETLANGWARFELVRDDYYNFEYWTTYPILWIPGVSLFSVLSALSIAPSIPLVLGVLAALVALARLVFKRRPSVQSIAPAILFLQLELFIVCSNLLFYFRDKEYRFTLPLFCLLLAIGLTKVVPDVYHLGREPGRRLYRRAKAGSGTARSA